MLNELAKEINKNARAKGFWEDMNKAIDIIDDKIDEYGICHKIKTQTINAFITQKIALVMSECGEAIESLRKDKYGIEQKDTFEDEIADAIIRLLDLCAELNIDIDKQIKWKMTLTALERDFTGKGFDEPISYN